MSIPVFDPSRLLVRLFAVASLLSLVGCASTTDGAAQEDEGALVGGAPESEWLAAGYLARADGSGGVLCGATLIGSGVVATAAHCVYRNKDTELAFGTGEVGGGRRVRVREVHYHPKAHVEADGFVDLVHALRLNDLAYLILDEPVRDVAPAILANRAPRLGDCDVRIIAYGDPKSDRAARKSAEGCVILKPEIHDDAIIEIRPHGGAVCHDHGDEGHAAITAGPDGRPVLIGVYVGSVSQAATDCQRHLQLFNGYEDVAGHSDFFAGAVAHGERVHGR